MICQASSFYNQIAPALRGLVQAVMTRPAMQVCHTDSLMSRIRPHQEVYAFGGALHASVDKPFFPLTRLFLEPLVTMFVVSVLTYLILALLFKPGFAH